jgi:hypothetical protein
MRFLFLFFIIVIFLAFPFPVNADIAPPSRPPGANPEPGNSVTQVSMMDETVLIDVQLDTPTGVLGTAKVSADFTMRNLSDSAESMAVRFPIGSGDGRGNIPEIKNMIIWVEGQSVQFRRISGEDPSGSSSEVPWVEFNAVFPPKQDVQIKVSYTLEAAGEMPYIWFTYIFSTGAGWQGSIGNAELTVRFPYKVSNLNIISGNESSTNGNTSGGVRSGNEIKWVWTHFEPDLNDNFMITLAAPSVWKNVIKEQAFVKGNPSDGEANGRLGKLYKSLLMSPHGGRGFRDFLFKTDPGAQDLFLLSSEAYEKAVTAKPDDALWHAGYADLLGFYAYYVGWEGYDTISSSVHALNEIHRALELAPNDPTV